MFSDHEMYEFLKTFINVVTSTYRTSESIEKDIFEYTAIDGGDLSAALSTVVSMIPMAGELASTLVDMTYERYKSIRKEQIQERASNIVNSFYHKEIEEIAEYVCVTFLYENRNYFKQLVLNEKNNREDKSYKSYSDLITEKIMKFARKTAGIETPSDMYKTPETNLAYRDAIQLINHKMATGKVLEKNGKLMTRDEKCEDLKEFLKSVSEISRADDDTILSPEPSFGTLFSRRVRD